ncbi:MAG: phage holin family protein [Gemmobacter sp.]
MLPSVAELKRAAGQTARQAAMAAAGGVLLAVGVAFLTVAIWIGLSDAFGPLVAALAIAALYAGAGLLVLWLGGRRQPAPAVPAPAARLRTAASQGTLFRPQGRFPPLVEAFLFGVSTYLTLRDRMSPPPRR